MLDTFRYRHNRTGEDDAHPKRQITGGEVLAAITDGRLGLGPWEQILYGEFDGRHRRQALVKPIGDEATTQSSWLRTAISPRLRP